MHSTRVRKAHGKYIHIREVSFLLHLLLTFIHKIHSSGSNSGVLARLSADPIPSSSSSASLLLPDGLLITWYCPMRVAATAFLLTAHRGRELLEYSWSRRLASSDLKLAEHVMLNLSRRVSRVEVSRRSFLLVSWTLWQSRSDPVPGAASEWVLIKKN